MLDRIKSALLAIPPVLLLLWLGGPYLLVLITFVVVMANVEYGRLASAKGILHNTWLSTAISILYLVDAAIFNGTYALPITGIALIVAVSLPVLNGDPSGALQRTSGMLFAPLYFGWTLSHAILLRATDGGIKGFILTLAVLGIVWIHDTMALLAGIASGGRTKLAPKISPKKSLEGSIGGALSMVAVMYLVYPLLSSRGYLPEIGGWQKAAFVLFEIICCNYGDLAESALKRDGGVKDSGRFLPGHGGFMDRIDSLLLFVPAAYWLFKIFLGW